MGHPHISEKSSSVNRASTVLSVVPVVLSVPVIVSPVTDLRSRRGGGVLDISLGGEVRHGPSYPDPV